MKRYNNKIQYRFQVRNIFFDLGAPFLLLMLLFSLQSCGGNSGVAANADLEEKKKQTISFLRFYIKTYITEDSAKLIKNPSKYKSGCLSSLPTKLGGNEIKWPDVRPDSSNWTPAETTGLEIISVPQNNTSVSKMPFYVLSRPIFSSDGNFISLYWEFYCGDRCGKGGIRLFKKKGMLWEEVGTYCDWVS